MNSNLTFFYRTNRQLIRDINNKTLKLVSFGLVALAQEAVRNFAAGEMSFTATSFFHISISRRRGVLHNNARFLVRRQRCWPGYVWFSWLLMNTVVIMCFKRRRWLPRIFLVLQGLQKFETRRGGITGGREFRKNSSDHCPPVMQNSHNWNIIKV